MRKHGWVGPPRRPRGPNRIPPPTPDPAVLRRLYVDEGLGIGTVAERLHLPPSVVRTALHTAGVPVSRPGWVAGEAPTPISKEQLQRLYVDQDLPARQVAEELGCSQTRVLAALRRHGIPVHTERPPVPPLLVNAATLSDLYVTQRLDDAEIGSRYGVPAWRVKKRRSELGVHRPVGTPPRPAPPDAPPTDMLHRWYVDQGHTLDQIARGQHTSKGVVRAWLTDAGIPVKPRTSREHRKHLDPVLIAELYQELESARPGGCAGPESAGTVQRVVHPHDVLAGGPHADQRVGIRRERWDRDGRRDAAVGCRVHVRSSASARAAARTASGSPLTASTGRTPPRRLLSPVNHNANDHGSNRPASAARMSAMTGTG